jgi:hypothetical protein
LNFRLITDEEGKKRFEAAIELELERVTVAVIFRKDFGEDARPIRPEYPDDIDHYNLELHVPNGRRGNEGTINRHLIPNGRYGGLEILDK